MKTPFAKVLSVALILAVAAPALGAEVDRREGRQQARIAEGVRSGALGPRETVRLERKEAKLHREIRHDRAVHGGRLTRAERAKVNREENRVSRQIYREKHDRRHI
jgi:hypothetical protein